MRDAEAEAVSRAAIQMGDASAATRIATLDIIRGFTLAGIIFANILWISGFLELSAAQRAPLMAAWSDGALLFAIRLLIFGKFYTVFAFLFGIGFAMQLQRAESRGQGFDAYFIRRMLILFLIGWAHALLIWWGDILRFYALLGLALLAMRRMPSRALAATIGLCLMLPLLLEAGSNYTGFEGSKPEFAYLQGAAELAFFQSAGFQKWFLYNLREIADHAIRQLWEGRIFHIFAMFLTGMWAARFGILEEPGRHRALLIRIAAVGLTVGFIGNLARTALGYADYGLAFAPKAIVTELFSVIAVPALSAGYVATLVLLCSSPAWCERFGFLSHLGRASLTNYVTQNILCVLIFRSYFLNLYGKLTLTVLVLLALGITAVQIILSRWWLARFRFGPLEWLWRSLTYGRWQELRRPSAR